MICNIAPNSFTVLLSDALSLVDSPNGHCFLCHGSCRRAFWFVALTPFLAVDAVECSP